MTCVPLPLTDRGGALDDWPEPAPGWRADPLDEAVRGLEPVGLDELVARAARLTRVDRKYLVPTEDAVTLLARLGAQARVLEIDGARRFPYVSVYHDTSDLSCYRSTAQKRRRRFKVRQRRYADTGDTFVEVKTRGARRTTIKQRTPTRLLGVLDAQDLDFVLDALGGQGIEAEVGDLRPVLTTRYVRTTVLLPDDAARVTFDTSLAWTAPGGATTSTDLVVVETKGGRTPSAADRLLWASGRRPARLSKFGTGMALLDDELPAHTWHRTLRRLHQRGATAGDLQAGITPHLGPFTSPDGISS